MTDLWSTGAPYVRRVSSDSFIEPSVENNCLMIRLDGRAMRTLEALFRAYVREFRFPEYFGWNWAAFDECITTLEGRPAHGYLTIIDHADDVFADELKELEPFEEALTHAGRTWAHAFALPDDFGGGEVPFHTIMVRESKAMTCRRSCDKARG